MSLFPSFSGLCFCSLWGEKAKHVYPVLSDQMISGGLFCSMCVCMFMCVAYSCVLVCICTCVCTMYVYKERSENLRCHLCSRIPPTSLRQGLSCLEFTLGLDSVVSGFRDSCLRCCNARIASLDHTSLDHTQHFPV